MEMVKITREAKDKQLKYEHGTAFVEVYSKFCMHIIYVLCAVTRQYAPVVFVI
jgi:hypothetical protein